MTLKEAINKFDAENRNNISDDLKISWLSLLDSDIYTNIVKTHENGDNLVFSEYSASTSPTTVLLVPEPFSDIYLHFLAMKKDLYYSDLSKYNNDVLLYSSAYINYENYYNRNNSPLRKTSYFNA